MSTDHHPRALPARPNSVDAKRLLGRIEELGRIGRDSQGRLTRLAATDADRDGRDALRGWIESAGLECVVDRIGNMHAVWREPSHGAAAAVMIGSHIDTVIDAGVYDGSYGVLAGLEVLQTLKAEGIVPMRPLVVAAFTNEEGVRFTPDMMGSLVFAGDLNLEEALASSSDDGKVLGEELARIGYAGTVAPGSMAVGAYLELHIEQGPWLDGRAVPIGAVESLQGISWHRIVIDGTANHAGTTPMAMRRDAGLVAARVVTFLRDCVAGGDPATVATVGSMRFEPDAINIIPGRAVLTVDIRNPDEVTLAAAEAALMHHLTELEASEGVTVTVERLVRFPPVVFDRTLVGLIEDAARHRGLAAARMTSGAGHDAQMMAGVCPAAMIFVPSVGGISHNPREHTRPEDLVAGADVLLDVVRRLVLGGGGPFALRSPDESEGQVHRASVPDGSKGSRSST